MRATLMLSEQTFWIFMFMCTKIGAILFNGWCLHAASTTFKSQHVSGWMNPTHIELSHTERSLDIIQCFHYEMPLTVNSKCEERKYMKWELKEQSLTPCATSKLHWKTTGQKYIWASVRREILTQSQGLRCFSGSRDNKGCIKSR